MKRCYDNQQRFSLSSNFPVAQRRFGWLLSKHPKRFSRKRGMEWRLTTLLTQSELTERDLERMEKAAGEAFIDAATAMQHVAKLRRKSEPEAKA